MEQNRLLNMKIPLILLIIGSSCIRWQKNDAETLNDTLFNRTIVFPTSLHPLKGDVFDNVDTTLYTLEGKLKVISIIDGICMTCIIEQLNKMDMIFSEIMKNKTNTQMVFILNVHSRDSSYFIHNLQPAIQAKGIILWDSNYNFETVNQLFTPDINSRTFLLDRENKIILYGNPIMKPELLIKYKEKLEQCF